MKIKSSQSTLYKLDPEYNMSILAYFVHYNSKFGAFIYSIAIEIYTIQSTVLAAYLNIWAPDSWACTYSF